ncbi:MAG TPA: alpha-glucuronidase family glycosyl hydrolase [Phycisphaerae bacterium]|jgi:alpha-glucuronidase
MEVTRRVFIASGVAGLAAASSLRVSQGQNGPAGARVPADEDGSKLWLRFAPPPNAGAYGPLVRQISVEGDSPTLKIIATELSEAIAGMIGTRPLPQAPDLRELPNRVSQQGNTDGIVVVGTPKSSQTVAALKVDAELQKLGADGYIIRTVAINNHPATLIASVSELGALYGTYHFLRLMQCGQPIAQLDISEHPKMMIRMADHWDNLTGAPERGYGGATNWKWSELPGTLSPRYKEYARAQASIGINGACINNVNANAIFLTAEYLTKIAALADVWRPYGVRVYLSVNFAAPDTLGHLPTADPLDPTVQKWWSDKAAEIYKVIPNFGGFLVKANSEGQPGPKTYNRTHAEGANCIADGLAPHGGYAIWRAFVYDEEIDADRVKRAYIEFMNLEGKFKPNVLIQIKNGPLDFQPREPFHPLFGAMKGTCPMGEIQPTEEYLGQGIHLVYLGTMWKEWLNSDTYAKGQGSTVGKYLEGKIDDFAVTGIAGVLNPGTDANWCGHHFSQANWYALGRLGWNHELTAEAIAEEWARMTFSNEPAVVKIIVDMMMGSRETFVNYTMPLGLHHMIGGNHYAPMPENAGGPRKDWTAVYYHQASATGIGFDRTKKGDKAVEQYFPPVCDAFDSLETCPDRFLLWFHHLAWDYKMKSGKTLWEEMNAYYAKGIKDVTAMQATWNTLAGKIDNARHAHVAARLQRQVTDATAWRQHILGYFAGINKLPVMQV